MKFGVEFKQLLQKNQDDMPKSISQRIPKCAKVEKISRDDE